MPNKKTEKTQENEVNYISNNQVTIVIDSKHEFKLPVDISKNVIKSIKDLIREDLSNEAIQASLKAFSTTHTIVKTFWFLCILVSMGLCSYLVVQSILTYLAYGVITTDTNIVENPTDFPKITICK